MTVNDMRKKSKVPKLPKKLTGRQFEKAIVYHEQKITDAMDALIEFAVFHGHSLPFIEEKLKEYVDESMCWYKNRD